MYPRTLIYTNGHFSVANLLSCVNLDGVEKTKVHRGNPQRHTGKQVKTSHRPILSSGRNPGPWSC